MPYGRCRYSWARPKSYVVLTSIQLTVLIGWTFGQGPAPDNGAVSFKNEYRDGPPSPDYFGELDTTDHGTDHSIPNDLSSRNSNGTGAVSDHGLVDFCGRFVPTFSQEPNISSMYVPHRKGITLWCLPSRNSSDYHPVIRWTLNGKILEPTTHNFHNSKILVKSSGTLHIQSFRKRKHAGIYQCQLSTSCGTIVGRPVNVTQLGNGPPPHHPTQLNLALGETALLRCPVLTPSTTNTIVTKDSPGEVVTDPRRTLYLPSSGLLIVRNLTRSDYGSYSCWASPERLKKLGGIDIVPGHGRNRTAQHHHDTGKTFSLWLTEPYGGNNESSSVPLVTAVQQPIEVEYGETVRLPCYGLNTSLWYVTTPSQHIDDRLSRRAKQSVELVNLMIYKSGNPETRFAIGADGTLEVGHVTRDTVLVCASALDHVIAHDSGPAFEASVRYDLTVSRAARIVSTDQRVSGVPAPDPFHPTDLDPRSHDGGTATLAVSLSCTTVGLPAPRLLWFREGRALGLELFRDSHVIRTYDDENRTGSNERGELTRHTLEITFPPGVGGGPGGEVTESLGRFTGIYQCMATNDGGSDHREFRITIPTRDDLPRMGGNLSTEVPISTVPAELARGPHDPSPSFNSTFDRYEDTNLVPVITLTTLNTTLSTGSDLRLECRTRANANTSGDLVITWLKDGVNALFPSLPSTQPPPVALITGTVKGLSTLRVRGARPGNSGRYSCVAVNGRGENSASITIKIEGETSHGSVSEQTTPTPSIVHTSQALTLNPSNVSGIPRTPLIPNNTENNDAPTDSTVLSVYNLTSAGALLNHVEKLPPYRNGSTGYPKDSPRHPFRNESIILSRPVIMTTENDPKGTEDEGIATGPVLIIDQDRRDDRFDSYGRLRDELRHELASLVGDRNGVVRRIGGDDPLEPGNKSSLLQHFLLLHPLNSVEGLEKNGVETGFEPPTPVYPPLGHDYDLPAAPPPTPTNPMGEGADDRNTILDDFRLAAGTGSGMRRSSLRELRKRLRKEKQKRKEESRRSRNKGGSGAGGGRKKAPDFGYGIMEPLSTVVEGLRNDEGDDGGVVALHTSKGDMIPPTPPNVTQLTNTSVILSWSVPQNDGLKIIFFKLQYRQLQALDPEWMTMSGEVDGNLRSSRLTGLNPGGTYKFRVAAVYENNDNRHSHNSLKFRLGLVDAPPVPLTSTASNHIQDYDHTPKITTSPPYYAHVRPAPHPPIILNIRPLSLSHFQVHWQAGGQNPDDGTRGGGYFIYYRPAGSVSPYNRIGPIAPLDSIKYDVTGPGLVPGSRYEVRMVSYTGHLPPAPDAPNLNDSDHELHEVPTVRPRQKMGQGQADGVENGIDNGGNNGSLRPESDLGLGQSIHGPLSKMVAKAVSAPIYTRQNFTSDITDPGVAVSKLSNPKFVDLSRFVHIIGYGDPGPAGSQGNGAIVIPPHRYYPDSLDRERWGDYYTYNSTSHLGRDHVIKLNRGADPRNGKSDLMAANGRPSGFVTNSSTTNRLFFIVLGSVLGSLLLVLAASTVACYVKQRKYLKLHRQPSYNYFDKRNNKRTGPNHRPALYSTRDGAQGTVGGSMIVLETLRRAAATHLAPVDNFSTPRENVTDRLLYQDAVVTTTTSFGINCDHLPHPPDDMLTSTIEDDPFPTDPNDGYMASGMDRRHRSDASSGVNKYRSMTLDNRHHHRKRVGEEVDPGNVGGGAGGSGACKKWSYDTFGRRKRQSTTPTSIALYHNNNRNDDDDITNQMASNTILTDSRRDLNSRGGFGGVSTFGNKTKYTASERNIPRALHIARAGHANVSNLFARQNFSHVGLQNESSPSDHVRRARSAKNLSVPAVGRNAAGLVLSHNTNYEGHKNRRQKNSSLSSSDDRSVTSVHKHKQQQHHRRHQLGEEAPKVGSQRYLANHTRIEDYGTQPPEPDRRDSKMMMSTKQALSSFKPVKRRTESSLSENPIIEENSAFTPDQYHSHMSDYLASGAELYADSGINNGAVKGPFGGNCGVVPMHNDNHFYSYPGRIRGEMSCENLVDIINPIYGRFEGSSHFPDTKQSNTFDDRITNDFLIAEREHFSKHGNRLSQLSSGNHSSTYANYPNTTNTKNDINVMNGSPNLKTSEPYQSPKRTQRPFPYSQYRYDTLLQPGPALDRSNFDLCSGIVNDTDHTAGGIVRINPIIEEDGHSPFDCATATAAETRKSPCLTRLSTFGTRGKQPPNAAKHQTTPSLHTKSAKSSTVTISSNLSEDSFDFRNRLLHHDDSASPKESFQNCVTADDGLINGPGFYYDEPAGHYDYRYDGSLANGSNDRSGGYDAKQSHQRQGCQQMAPNLPIANGRSFSSFYHDGQRISALSLSAMSDRLLDDIKDNSHTFSPNQNPIFRHVSNVGSDLNPIVPSLKSFRSPNNVR